MVLNNIDLHIKSGETIGIIGSTGCGKTSLVNLISRLYDVDDGSVCVGGKDVRDYDMEYLRNQVSVVLQKNVLFSGTILDNLRWATKTPQTPSVSKPVRLPALTSSLNAFLKSMKLISNRAAQTYQADRSKDFVSQERF